MWTRGQTHYLRLEHCDIGTVKASETSTLSSLTSQPGRMSALATGDMSAVETRQMSGGETGLFWTGQMSAALPY